MKRYKVIACEIAFRELCHCASCASCLVDFSFMTKGLHDKGKDKMKETLQAEIDKVETDKYDAILLAYGLCSNGVVGLKSKLPIVIPKAHDCTTFFLGSKEKYAEFFDNYPGTYIYTAGWIERDINQSEIKDGIMSQLGISKTYEEYVEQYGEENADFIMEILSGYETSYNKILFINTGVGDVERYRAELQEKAKEKNWTPSEIQGDLSLLQKFLNGDWNESDFAVIPPNSEIIATNDKEILAYKQLSS